MGDYTYFQLDSILKKEVDNEIIDKESSVVKILKYMTRDSEYFYASDDLPNHEFFKSNDSFNYMLNSFRYHYHSPYRNSKLY